MKILLGDFNTKDDREEIFKHTIGNESLHEIGNDNGVKVVISATSKKPQSQSTMFPHHIIYNYIWTYPDGKSHNQIGHILVDRRRLSSVLESELPVVLYECETWSLTLREEHRLRVFENRVLRTEYLDLRVT
jgi:hypothetical protein